MGCLSFHSECHTSGNSETSGLTAPPLDMSKKVPFSESQVWTGENKAQRAQISQASHSSAKATATISPSQDLVPDYGWCHHCLSLDSFHPSEMVVMGCSLLWLHVCVPLMSIPPW